MTTTTTTTQIAQPSSTPATSRRTPRRLRRRLAALVLVLAGVAGIGTVTATSASAATAPGGTLAANCNVRSISAEAPTLQWAAAGWAVSYRFRVYEYNSSGWVLRQLYPSTGYLTTRSGWGMGNDVFTFSARSGYAYNVSVDEYWYFNGVYQGYNYQSEIHSTAGAWVSTSPTWCRVL
jgi:hypothetical protein